VAKLNLLLLLVLVVCALGLVTSQHKSRKLFSELEREQERSRALDVEFGQLQLEASTWGLHSRVEKIAVGTLGMRAPDPRRVRMVEARKTDTRTAGTQPAAPALVAAQKQEAAQP
jgi:cell division protein FtsL